MIHFCCVNVGPKYPMSYVEILLDMVLRNSSQVEGERAFWCVTDRPDELPEGVGYLPADPDLPGWWQKIALFSPHRPEWADGERIVYFDLDVVITGRLEDLVERKGIIKDWHWPCYNSSVMVWDHGEFQQIWDRFTPDQITAPATPELLPLLPAGHANGGDQEWITEVSKWPTFPADWFRSYRDCHAWPPSNCKAVIFHGATKPADVTEGWVPNVWKCGGYTSLPELKGVNVTYDQIRANIEASVQRDLPWFTGFGPHKRPAVIVGGGPSMKDRIGDIKAQKRRGAQVISVNNAWRFLVENGVRPDIHVMLDARPENAAFVQDAPSSTRYFIASQCHPEVFDALAGKSVVLWHNGFGENDILKEVLAPWWDEGPEQRPCVLVPGGGTVGLRAMWLAALSGFKTLHLYGFDSSYADTGEHHAYAQPLNDADATLSVRTIGQDGREREYLCARWHVRQCEEFKEHWRDLRREFGVQIHVHGSGLLPAVAKSLREEERA